MLKLTRPQTTALLHLHRNLDQLPRTASGNIATGCNTTVLHKLRDRYLITCSRVWLSGVTSNDLTLTDQGREIAAALQRAATKTAAAAPAQ